jgi:uncharacterized membrane protein (UPF0136 family)
MNSTTQFILALSTLLAAIGGLINSFRNTSKIKDVAEINTQQTNKLNDIKDQTDGLTQNLSKVSLDKGIAQGLAQGIAQEREVAKNLLNEGKAHE